MRAAITCTFLCLLAGARLASAQTVSVWLTTDNLSSKLSPQTPVAFTNGIPLSNPVIVDETQTYQQMEGFGA